MNGSVRPQLVGTHVRVETQRKDEARDGTSGGLRVRYVKKSRSSKVPRVPDNLSQPEESGPRVSRSQMGVTEEIRKG